jgi:hypothetical protein
MTVDTLLELLKKEEVVGTRNRPRWLYREAHLTLFRIEERVGGVPPFRVTVFLELPGLGLSSVVFRCAGECEEEILGQALSSISEFNPRPFDDLVSQIERARALVRGEGGGKTALERLAGDESGV